eukprot:symbB.v1.2.039031.t1/scaffold6305.1/size19173/2
MSGEQMDDLEDEPFAVPGLSWMLLGYNDVATGSVKQEVDDSQTEAPSPASDAEMALPVDQAAVDGEQVDEMKSALDFLVDQAEDKEEEYEEVKEEPPEIKPEVKNDEKEKMEPRNLKRKLPEPVVEKLKVAPWWRNSGQQNPGGPASGSGLKRPKPEVGVAGGESKKNRSTTPKWMGRINAQLLLSHTRTPSGVNVAD